MPCKLLKQKKCCSILFYSSSKIPTNYKWNAITSELHRAKKITTDFF